MTPTTYNPRPIHLGFWSRVCGNLYGVFQIAVWVLVIFLVQVGYHR